MKLVSLAVWVQLKAYCEFRWKSCSQEAGERIEAVQEVRAQADQPEKKASGLAHQRGTWVRGSISHMQTGITYSNRKEIQKRFVVLLVG